MSQVFQFGPFRLDTERQVLLKGPEVVELGQRAIGVLRVLLDRAGEVVSKDELFASAWHGLVVEGSNLPVQVAALRRALGEHAGANSWIETLPRRGYRYVGPKPATGPAAVLDVAGELGEQRGVEAIAVLPFENHSASPDLEFFGDAISNDIIAALTRFRWFEVVSRNSSFYYKGQKADIRQIAKALGARYVLEGSHRQLDKRIRVTADLIDASIGKHIWAERYERNLDDIFAIQDEITSRVVGAIEPELLRREAERGASSAASRSTAHDLVRKGIWFFHQVQPDTHERALETFRSAVKLAPQHAEPHIWLARVAGGMGLWGWGENPRAVVDEGLNAAVTAIGIDERDPYAHYGLAITSCPANLLEQASRAAVQAIELSPNFALGHLVLGMSVLYSGSATTAKGSLHRGLQLSSYDPHKFVWLDLLALAHLFCGEVDDAIRVATQALTTRPRSQLALEIASICHAAAGQLEKARQLASAKTGATPGPNSVLAPLMVNNPEWRGRLHDLFEKCAT